MSSFSGLSERRPVLVGAILWAIAAVLTLATFTYQDKTGPTQPLTGAVQTGAGPVSFEFLRSETIGTPLSVVLVGPVPSGVTGFVRYRRYMSNDQWRQVPMTAQTFVFSRRGSKTTIEGVGVRLPSLHERAGKYEYLVYVSDGISKPFSVTGKKPIFARYQAPVPNWVLIIHIVVIFASMLFALRTVLEAMLPDGDWEWLIWATIASLVLGAFVLGPLVQWYAFGVWWSGIPFGWDWTDNKVLLELLAWGVAAYLNSAGRRSRASVFVAGGITLLVYFIPHSLFGSEYNYVKGVGRGTAG